MPTNLAEYRKQKGLAGRNKLVVGLWYLCNHLIFNHGLFPFSKFKGTILRIFGARIGQGVVIKPNINIKYPWRLEIGDHVWIGEDVWLDNLVWVRIASHVCISQGAMLLTGNHDYQKKTFDLIAQPIQIERGAWIGAKALVTPGVIVHEHAVLTAGSVATKNLEPYMIYQGNPATPKRRRRIQ